MLRAGVVYFLLLAMIRMTGKRTMGQFTPFDMLLVVLLGNAVQNALLGADTSVGGGLLLAATLIALNWTVGLVSARSPKVERWVEGSPVLLARDGQEALRLFERHADEVRLVLLDAVMPVVAGHVVYQEISARRPKLPILVASGYTSSVFPDDFFARRSQDFIPKPYDADQLLRRVREALDAANS